MYPGSSVGPETICNRNRRRTCTIRRCWRICRSCTGPVFFRTRLNRYRTCRPAKPCNPADTRICTNPGCFDICRSGKFSGFRNIRRYLQETHANSLVTFERRYFTILSTRRFQLYRVTTAVQKNTTVFATIFFFFSIKHTTPKLFFYITAKRVPSLFISM